MTLMNKPQGFPFMKNMLSDFFADDDFFGNRWIVKDWMPAVNVSEDNGEYHIEMAAPGMNKDDFDVKVENGILTISSEIKDESEKEEMNYTRKEFSYSSFKRSFRIPEDADNDSITAKYDNGLLKLTVAKKQIAEAPGKKAISVA